MSKRTELNRQARAQVWMALAMRAQIVHNEIMDESGTTRSFAEWPEDDPIKELMKEFGFDREQLAKAFVQVAESCEKRALHLDYQPDAEFLDSVVAGF